MQTTISICKDTVTEADADADADARARARAGAKGSRRVRKSRAAVRPFGAGRSNLASDLCPATLAISYYFSADGEPRLWWRIKVSRAHCHTHPSAVGSDADQNTMKILPLIATNRYLDLVSVLTISSCGVVIE